MATDEQSRLYWTVSGNDHRCETSEEAIEMFSDDMRPGPLPETVRVLSCRLIVKRDHTWDWERHPAADFTARLWSKDGRVEWEVV